MQWYIVMNILFWNVRGLGGVSKRALVRHDLRVICANWLELQETKLRSVNSNVANYYVGKEIGVFQPQHQMVLQGKFYVVRIKGCLKLMIV